jgi:hypothetical protein
LARPLDRGPTPGRGADGLDPEGKRRQNLRPEDLSEELLEPIGLGQPYLPARPLNFVSHLASGVLERTLSNRLAEKIGRAARSRHRTNESPA